MPGADIQGYFREVSTWRCYRCGKLLGEWQRDVEGHVVLYIRHGRVRLWVGRRVCRVCEKCGAVNCVETGDQKQHKE